MKAEAPGAEVGKVGTDNARARESSFESSRMFAVTSRENAATAHDPMSVRGDAPAVIVLTCFPLRSTFVLTTPRPGRGRMSSRIPVSANASSKAY